MRKSGGAAALALLVMAGCGNPLPGASDQRGSAVGNANESAPHDRGAPQRLVADAGVTRSRSLAGLTGDAASGGGKNPAVVEASAAGPIAPAFLVGRWSDDGSCKDQFEFFADGTFLSASGIEGEWRLEGTNLILAGPGSTVSARLGALGPDHLQISNPDGSTSQSMRC